MSKRKKKFRVKMRRRNKDLEIVTNIEGRKEGPGMGEKAHHRRVGVRGPGKEHHGEGERRHTIRGREG